MKKKLLVTFDYELYLGRRSGSVAECMTAPTELLMEAMRPYNIRSVFFVDTTYLLRLKEQAGNSSACAADLKLIHTQLTKLVQNGHYVFPHIHPHWLDAVYMPESNEWRLDNTRKYRFHELNEVERLRVFNGSMELLRDLLGGSFPDYLIDSYRAGGWCIQPFSDFLPFFKKNGVSIDFSVLPGFYQFSDAQQFDFTNAPKKPWYRFENDVCIESNSGPFTQFTISSLHVPQFIALYEKVLLKILYKLTADHTFRKGQGQPSNDIEGKIPASPGGYNITNSSWERISVELLNAAKLPLYMKFVRENEYMHFISHPKMVTRHNIRTFARFLKTVHDTYSVESDFRKMIA